ncbi:Histidinol-phosphate aminotransferase [bioreactor metagenome]|uniref:Histidinol-phosphate aminotransferase n=1 Tax=bioreactor metagenome TaxID=1076179 RepID=A0A645BAE3_9ZZZZ|nr:aminotransferase class I/II-fold pyridoxal phosphate-dependent enzyme [Erysipelotrichaceae bacterium]
MRFTKKNMDDTPLIDNVFTISQLAQKAADRYGPDQVVNATIGSLYTEAEIIAAFDSVYSVYDQISNETKAQYAQSISGNETYIKSVYDWVRAGVSWNLHHDVIATPGGTGAIALTMMDLLDEGMSVLLPNLAWSSYRQMAKTNNLQIVTYEMFDKDHFNCQSLIDQARRIMEKQGKVMVIINDPCHNPSGYSMTVAEWKTIIDALNQLAQKGPCILVNDIAYIDYSLDVEHSRDYFKLFNTIAPGLAVIVAHSCSKTLTSYGMRLGAAIILAQEQSVVTGIKDAFINSARSIWSNVNNSWMDNFSQVVTANKDAFIKEKQQYIQLLQARSEVFIREAQSVGLAIYPYKEGFFITVKVPDIAKLTAYHQALMDNNIFTVKLMDSIRLAICSVPVSKMTGLAIRMKKILDQLD